jgi:raffinose/stachyose/melibiose transport system permease protein
MSAETTTEAATPPGASGSTPTGRATPRPARRRGNWRTRLELTFLIGPALVLFLGMVLLPICFAVYYSFFHWTGFGPKTRVGFRNYSVALHDPVFQQAVVHTLILAGLSLVIQGPIAIAIALLLNRRFRGRSVVRLAVFAPYVLAEAVTAVIWLLMLQPGGFVDQVFKALGMDALVQQWLANPSIVLYTLFVVLTWKYIGFAIILFLAGLQGIPSELREAASIDGASPWQVTWFITLPLLGPTIRIWGFLSLIGSLQVFDVVWIMTQGGPADASTTIATYVIDHGFQRYEFGYGSATAVLLFIICFVFALAYQSFVLRRDVEGASTPAAG